MNRLTIRSVLALLVPGTVIGLIPYFIVSQDGGASRPHWGTLEVVLIAPIAIGLSIMLRCVVDFAVQGRGTLAPLDPPTQLVQRGLYRYVRNPMYLGALLILLGSSALFRSTDLLAYTAVWFAFVNAFVLFYEEPVLRETFGESYAAYCSTVGRWVPTIRTKDAAFPAVVAIAVLKLILHATAIEQYGFFRDELYYLASTDRLSWGYVDHPPLSIAVLAGIRAIFGDSLLAIRFVPALAGAAIVIVTALIARRLGGGRYAQVLAALCATMAPVFLAAAHYYSMNVFDQLFWAVAALALLHALDRTALWQWAVIGCILGVGFLNKISILWLCVGMFVGLAFTSYRRVLLQRGVWVAAVVGMAIGLPHVLWQIAHGWPTLEFMQNATSVKMSDVSPLQFLVDQVLSMNPGAAPVWLAGLFLGLAGGARGGGRVLAWIYVSVFALLLLAGRSRASYLAPAYPALFALGGIAWERFTATGRPWLRPTLAAAVVVIGLVIAPFALPMLPVETFVRYQSALGIVPRTEERQEMGLLPQQYADMFGWEEMAALVGEAYDRLTPEERAHCGIFGQNYGEAGAVDLFGRRRGLPPAISGHNSYWLWGPGSDRIDVLIIIGGKREDNARYFDQIDIIGQTRSRWSMPYEQNLDISIARRPKADLRALWPSLKKFV